MSALQVSQWKRYGRDRLYVNLPDGTAVAWFDRQGGFLHVLVAEHRDAALLALAPYLADPLPASLDAPPPPAAVPPSPSPPPLTGLPLTGPGAAGVPGAIGDLAAHRPGEMVRRKLAETGPGPFWHLLLRLLGRRTEADSWHKGLTGERIAGAELARLTRHGWRVLHSIPLARDVDIDHLLIGPGGVFCVNTKHHPGARIWVGDEAVRIGPDTYPYVRKSRAEARRAGKALTRGCGFEVTVRPVLAFVRAERLTVAPSLRDVLAVDVRELAAFRARAGELGTGDVDRVHAVARDPGTWAGA
ncbi:nuclease-related domain-containing protein [Streptomyces sp. NBC_01803]|uniref:nuclease-related domain-containing protein n=1 Tax=Streptomyces sp. NBC_01803 TaxID=2975946 RepID=UPI002DDA6116|nr:nuclease-related domain-containing protein [Streptomyces sp. NBC_01803]WSA46787.1 NERD domain-containing protein [Streptomyces sp. NBC_01803]